MKPYPQDVLATRISDREPTLLGASSQVKALFSNLRQEGLIALDEIASIVKQARQIEVETVYDHLYRRAHVVAGTAKLIQLPKLEHLLELLELAIDIGRHEQSFEKYSLGYVVSLLVEASKNLINDLHDFKRGDCDVSDIVDECRTYLTEPLRTWNAPANHSPSGDVACPIIIDSPTTSTFVRTVSEVKVPTSNESSQSIMDDSPEELEIPTDKVGLTSSFCEESRESLAQVGHLLVDLEDAADRMPLVNQLFRSVHTVKGGSRMLKIRKMETLAHRMESLLDRVRKEEQPVNPQLIDVLLDGRKLLEQMVDEVASRGPILTRISSCLDALTKVESGTASSIAECEKPALPATITKTIEVPTPREAKTPPPDSVRGNASESIRITTEKLDDVLNTASEVFISRIRLASDVTAINVAIRHFKQTMQRMEEFGVESILNRLAESNRKQVLELRSLLSSRDNRATPEKIASIVNRFHQELLTDTKQHSFSTPEEFNLNLLSIDEIRKRMQKNVEHLEQLSTRLQTGAMSFRMVPISQLFDRFPTQIREVARQLGKKARLEVSGSDTELDKVLINQLSDPLLHLLRNAIDHGIESSEDRLASGKPETGHLNLRAYYHGSHAVIEVQDDGKGIDSDRVLAKAIQNGLVDSERAKTLSRQEIFQFIFEPGLSTAAAVSTLSGRGVGMDVVKTAISELQGNITIDSEPNRGTTVRMKLPLTLAVVGILLVRERNQQFALPIQHVDKILTVKLSEVHRVSENTIYNYRGTTLPVATLSGILDFSPSDFSDKEVSLVILSEGEKKIGVLVDAVLGRQEVLIKSLGSLIKKAPFVMGCTILSDSRLVLILNAWEIVNARSHRPLPEQSAERSDVSRVRKEHTILVVDDSAIQRHHLSSILNHAGYTVECAENGFEGMKRLRNRHHSAICVDVVMPLMDGFEFTERLRRQAGHQKTPVMFITGQATDLIRERALNLGVYEYFQKPIDAEILIGVMDRICMPDQSPIVVNKP